MTAYEVKTEIFEGPLELLLDLIEKRKFEISQISLAGVTDDFLSYVKNLSEIKLGDISHFILVAATLILIKSKSLLPAMELTPEEESNITELEDRLRRFQVLRNAIPGIRERYGRFVIFNRSGVSFVPVFAPDPAVNISVLVNHAWQAINQMPKREFLPQVPVRRVVSLQEVMKNLIDRIEKGLEMTFRDFAKGNFKEKREERFNLVISFLALLELVNQGIIAVTQSEHFADISLEKTKIEIV